MDDQTQVDEQQGAAMCAGPAPRGLPGAAATIRPVPTTVGGGEPERESGVIGEQQWRAMRERREAGASVSKIAREWDLDRKTVRRALAQGTWQPYRREAPAATLLDAHREWLSSRAPQVHYSARILHQELTRERGFTGCYETVKLAVRPLRAAATVSSLTQRRFETGPGEQAQCDWGQITVRFAGVHTKVHVFVMTLGYSRRGFAMGFMRERTGDLLSAHEAAFAHFGGRCEQLLYDRMRTVVLGESEGRAQLNKTFAAFAAHWGFNVRLCQPYRAQTKGKVESGVKYVKRNFVPGRQFRDLEDFNAQLEAWQRDIADVRVHGTTHVRPIERFAEEVAHLVPTSSQPSFLAAMIRDRVVAEDWLVSIDGNRYSVPFALIGKTVQVVRVGGSWQIRHRGGLIAEHAVLAGRAQLSVRPEHGPGAAARNVRQRFGSGAARVAQAAHAEVEIRDLALYDQLTETVSTAREAA
jgi:transposase